MANEQNQDNQISNAEQSDELNAEDVRDLSSIWHIIFLIVLVLAILILFLLFLRQDPEKFKFWKQPEEKEVFVADKEIYHNVSGDHFVNELLINLEKTNLRYDRTTTAFTFNPLYDWLDGPYCFEPFCGFNFFKEEYCLADKCLSASGRNLTYQGQPQTVPDELKTADILNVAIFPLKNEWLVGYVYRLNGIEQGRAYRFNGQAFLSLDPLNKVPFVSRTGFEGAKFGFGGDDSNFLVMYGGYYMGAYQVVGGELYDISQFFGLRVADGGFKPWAMKMEKNRDLVWYVCSTEANKPRLIKLWQNGSASVKGSISFTESLLQRATSAWCQPSDTGKDLNVVIEKNGAYELKILSDRGFNQNQNYLLRTKNLFKEEGTPTEVSFSSLLGCGSNGCGEKMLDSSIRFYFSGNGERFSPASLEEEIVVAEGSTGLYWQIDLDAKPASLDYSPWVDGLTAISYAWQAK